MVPDILPTMDVAGAWPLSRDRSQVESDGHADPERDVRILSVCEVTDSARIFDEAPAFRRVEASDNALNLLWWIDPIHGDLTLGKRLDPNVFSEDGSRSSGDTTVKGGGMKPPPVLAVRDVPKGAIHIKVRHEGARQALRIASRI